MNGMGRIFNCIVIREISYVRIPSDAGMVGQIIKLGIPIQTAYNQREMCIRDRFNVKAYEEDDWIEVSLSEGKVEVQSEDKKRRIFLSPGEQMCIRDSCNVVEFTANQIVYGRC